MEHTWYVLPPKTTSEHFGTQLDWNQTLMSTINMLIYESIERRAYGVEFSDYANVVIDDGICVLTCNPYRRELINSLAYYDYVNEVLRVSQGRIKISFSANTPKDVLQFKNGIYENEITLIDSHYGE